MSEPAAIETKSMPETVTAAFDDFMHAFEAFREANDSRLSEIERRLAADCLTEEKADRINRSIDEHRQLVDRMLLKKARPQLGASATALHDHEHKAAFDAYLRRGDEAGLRALETRAFSAGSGADGGYLAPPELDAAIGTRLAAVSPLRALATVRTISAAVLKKPFAATGLSAGWAAETAARPQTDSPQLVELSFPTMELYAMPAVSQALLDDAAVDIEAWITAELDTVFAEQEGAAFVNGNGIDRPKGVLSYDTVPESAWVSGRLGHVATGSAGGWKPAGPSDTLIDLVYALKAGHRRNASFVMNRKTQADIRKFKDADGNYLWQPPAGPGQPASLIGFPVTEAEEMPDIAANALPLAFGDFAAGYLVVDRAGLSVLRDPYSAKPYVLFYTTKRVGGGVQDFEAIKLLKVAV